MNGLETTVQDITTGFDGRVGYAIKNLATGMQVAHDADRMFPTASAIKWPLLTAFQEYLPGSALSWDDVIDPHRLPTPAGSGVLTRLGPAVRLSYRDAAWLMICVSDNLATNLILDAIGIDTANAIMHRLISPELDVLRPAGFGTGEIGDTMGRATPRALLRHVELLARDELPGAADTLAIARDQFYRSGLARYIPEPDDGPASVVIASKSGSMPRVRTDSGLLQAGEVAIAAAVMIDDYPDRGYGITDPAQQCIGDVARAALLAWTELDVDAL